MSTSFLKREKEIPPSNASRAKFMAEYVSGVGVGVGWGLGDIQYDFTG